MASSRIGHGWISLEPGTKGVVTFSLHADLTSFAGSDGLRVVEEGPVELRVATPAAMCITSSPSLSWGPRRLGFSRRLVSRSGVDVAPWSQKEVNVV